MSSERGMAGWGVDLLAGGKANLTQLAADLASAPEEALRALEAARAALMTGAGVRGVTYFAILLFVGIAVEWLYWTYAYAPLRALQAARPETPPQALRLGLRRLLLLACGMLLFTLATAGASAAFAWPPGVQESVVAAALLLLALRFAWAAIDTLFAPGRPAWRLVPVAPSRAGVSAAAAMATAALLALGVLLPGILEQALGARHVAGALRFAAFGGAALIAAAAALALFGRDAGAPRRAPLFPRGFLLSLLVAAVCGAALVHAGAAGLAVIIAVVLALQLVLRDIVYFYWGGADGAAAPAIALSAARFVTVLAGTGVGALALQAPLGGLADAASPWVRVGLRALGVVVLAMLAHGVWIAVRSMVDQRLAAIRPADPDHPADAGSRLLTLLPLMRVTTAVVLLVTLVLSSLWALGIEITPLLAGAGVVGLAVGFGAQTLVKDIVSGVFYLIDDAFRIGEYIQSGNFKGQVESFSLRSVRLRHHRGPIFTVPFGTLGAIQNMSRDWVIDKLSVGITYDSDLEKARKLVKGVGKKLAEDPELGRHFLEPLKMQGVEQFGDFAVQIRMKMKTRPGEQFVIRRKALAMIKKAFDDNGIRFAFPTVQLAGNAEPNAAAAAAAARQVLARDPAASPPRSSRYLTMCGPWAAADFPRPIQPRSPITASSRRRRISRLEPSTSRKVPLADWSTMTKLPSRPKTRACTREASALATTTSFALSRPSFTVSPGPTSTLAPA
jgi:small-conductance mechanosensitive channel